MNSDASDLPRLSPRERTCLRLVYDRKTTKEIATELGIEATTIDGYIAHAIRELGARNRRHAAELLYGHDDIPPKDWGAENPRVVATEPPPPVSLVKLLPLRSKGTDGNDLPIGIRLLWIPLLAIALAIGFGVLVNGLQGLSNLTR